MSDLFSLAEARAQRDQGMTQAAYGYGAADWLESARAAAKQIAMRQGTVSADDVLEACPRPPHVHPNATGSIFKGNPFEIVAYRTSRKTSAHARRIAVYQLKVGE